MSVALGDDVVATLTASSATLVMGARIEVPVTRAIVSYYRLASFDEQAGRWTVTLEGPPSTGDYNLVWRSNDAEPPELEVSVPLTIAPEGVRCD